MHNTSVRSITSTARKAASALSSTAIATTGAGASSSRAIRMRVIVNQKGLVHSSHISMPKPITATGAGAATGVRGMHSSAMRLKVFHAEVSSSGTATVAMAGSNSSFEKEYASYGSFFPVTSTAEKPLGEAFDEFAVGRVETVGNVDYSNKHSE